MRTPADILDFWFSNPVKERWYNSTPEFDADLVARFGNTAQSLAKGPFPHPKWEADSQSALALIIALDQLPRNMFRGKAEAFQWDPLALSVANRMIDKGWDMDVPIDRRPFVYMPLMHAEDLTAQNRCIELSSSRLDDKGSTLRHAIAHRDVIEKFGRFPYRNATLNRQMTPEEGEFLEKGGYNPS